MKLSFDDVTVTELREFLKDSRGLTTKEMREDDVTMRLQSAVMHLNMALGYVESSRGAAELKRNKK